MHFLTYLYWPVVTVLAVASIATLFHISTPQRSPWLRDVPGAVLTLVIWVLASFVLRGTITASVKGGTSIYGPLSTPIVLLIFLYALAIAVLIGAALNAAIRGHVAGRGAAVAAGQAGRVGQGLAEAPQGRRTSPQRPDAASWLPRPVPRTADEELSSSVKALRDEARKPLTPMPRTPGTDTDDTQFGDDTDDRIMSARTRSG